MLPGPVATGLEAGVAATGAGTTRGAEGFGWLTEAAGEGAAGARGAGAAGFGAAAVLAAGIGGGVGY